MNYDYPPSSHIRRYEPFEPNSHYYVRGDCLYEGKKYLCDFELAFTLSGQIYVVCYIDIGYRNELFSHPLNDGNTMWKSYIPKETRIQVSFEGTELRNGHKIVVEQAISLRNGMGFMWDEPPIFFANSYSLQITDEDILHNNPPQDTLFDIINVHGDLALTGPNQFNIGVSKPLILNIASQPNLNSTLSVPNECIPEGWRVDDVAELWCNCISFATGTDIRWIVQDVRTEESITQTYVRRRNITRNLSTFSVISTGSPFWIDNVVHNFVKTVFTAARDGSISVEAIRDYTRLMWHFVEYRLITNRAEDQARLISTTVEELLTRWEDHTSNTPSAVVSAAESALIWSDVQSNYLKQLSAKTGITDKNRLDALNSRLETFFTDDILRPGFGKRLRKFFKLGKNDNRWFKTQVPETLLDSFITTRNKIAHEGRFPSKASEELFEYYSEMLMILPLMIFSIFGYTGSYVDLAEEYRRIKANRLAQKKSQGIEQDKDQAQD